jgi:hypothetical protein
MLSIVDHVSVASSISSSIARGSLSILVKLSDARDVLADKYSSCCGSIWFSTISAIVFFSSSLVEDDIVI